MCLWWGGWEGIIHSAIVPIGVGLHFGNLGKAVIPSQEKIGPSLSPAFLPCRRKFWTKHRQVLCLQVRDLEECM